MSKQRKLSDALILPFAFGLIVGGALTGFVICFGLGEVERLLGGMHTEGVPKNPNQQIVLVGEWLCTLLLSVFAASLFELLIVKLITMIAAFPLSPRLKPQGLFIVGTLVACGCTIISCLTIDLGPHPELHPYKGPSPPFPYYVFSVCAIAPLLLLRREELDSDDGEDWSRLSLECLERAYGDDEPEYTSDSIREANPSFKTPPSSPHTKTA